MRNDNWLLMKLDKILESENDFDPYSNLVVNQSKLSDEFLNKYNTTYSTFVVEGKCTHFPKVSQITVFNSRKGSLYISDNDLIFYYDLATISSDPKTKCDSNQLDFFTFGLKPH